MLLGFLRDVGVADGSLVAAHTGTRVNNLVEAIAHMWRITYALVTSEGSAMVIVWSVMGSNELRCRVCLTELEDLGENRQFLGSVGAEGEIVG